jgi:hypothetical protein
MTFLYTFAPTNSTLSYWERVPSSAIDSALYFGSHFFLSYGLMYFVIPRYIVKAKYVRAALLCLLLMILTGVIAALTSLYVLEPVKTALLPHYFTVPRHPIKEKDDTLFYLALIAGLRGALTIGGVAASIKIMKHWYIKEQANLRLQKENAESQLQVLKAQVHPHFLFNTLNNIYSFTQNTAPAAAGMICGLSDILRYMLYECDKSVVPLAKELKMLEEYISLEQIRYGNQLEVSVDLPQNNAGLSVAPLLLLPFVENCFKHGTSHVLDQPWIHLAISVDKPELTMKLMNSKAAEKPADHQYGIGIANVKTRLALLYPEKHQLTITEEEDVFIVLLKLTLEENNKMAMGKSLPEQIVVAN